MLQHDFVMCEGDGNVMFFVAERTYQQFREAPPEWNLGVRVAVVHCVQCKCERAAYSLCGLGALLRVASVGRAPAGGSERAEALTRTSEGNAPALCT